MTRSIGTSVVWLRRDLRLHDNVALYDACRRSDRVCVAFVLDPSLLRSERVGAPLVQAFFNALTGMREQLRSLGSDLVLLDGDFEEQLLALAGRVNATELFYNEDYEPDAIRRDKRVEKALGHAGVTTHSSLDHVYFGADELEKDNGEAYKVFTPYRKRWLDQRYLANRHPVPSYESAAKKFVTRESIGATCEVPSPEAYGHPSSAAYPHVSEEAARRILEDFLEPGGSAERYKEARNVPAIDGTSRLSPHLRAGTIGIRECVERAFERIDALAGAERESIECWISELIWRDFYQMVLKRFPHVAEGAFLEAGSRVAWRHSERDFSAWCEGRTGYPIVDAAMRQLNASGWMHNRLRMIVASFLTKHLLIDWRRGERYFEQHLADGDLAQNNGGWQWAASTGTDAAPYFRIFSPVRQSKNFDPTGTFIRSMVPELRSISVEYIHEPWTAPPLLRPDYPAPIVDHAFARDRALAAFAPIMRGARQR